MTPLYHVSHHIASAQSFETLDEIRVKKSLDKLRHCGKRLAAIYCMDRELLFLSLLFHVARQEAIPFNDIPQAFFGIAALVVDAVPFLSARQFSLFLSSCLLAEVVCRNQPDGLMRTG